MPLNSPFRHSIPHTDQLLGESIHVNEVGWLRRSFAEAYESPMQQAPMIYRYHWNEGRTMSEFVLVLIAEGEGELDTRRGKQAIQQGTAFLLRPGEWHRHRPLPGTVWTNMWICFDGTLPRRWLSENSFRLHGNMLLLDHYPEFLLQFKRLLLSVHRAPFEDSARLSCQMLGLLSHFLYDDPDQNGHGLHADSIVASALAFIWSNPHESVSVLDVATHVDCGRRSLERRFKEGIGRSILAEIQACRMERAKRLLVETHLPLKECAMRAGFKTRAHMRQVFRKQYGISPELFRKQRVEMGTDSPAKN